MVGRVTDDLTYGEVETGDLMIEVFEGECSLMWLVLDVQECEPDHHGSDMLMTSYVFDRAGDYSPRIMRDQVRSTMSVTARRAWSRVYRSGRLIFNSSNQEEEE